MLFSAVQCSQNRGEIEAQASKRVQDDMADLTKMLREWQEQINQQIQNRMQLQKVHRGFSLFISSLKCVDAATNQATLPEIVIGSVFEPLRFLLLHHSERHPVHVSRQYTNFLWLM